MAYSNVIGKTGWETGLFNGTKVRTYAENNTCEVEMTGNFTSMTQPKTGDTVSYPFLPSAEGKVWGVQSSSLTHDTAGVATLHVSCVWINSATGAYDETDEVDMQEVQRSLKQHPTILADSTALLQIQMWEKTPEGVRVYSDSSGLKFRYYLTTDDDPEGVLTDVSNTNAEMYMKAYVAGIETYNVYLPVITRNTKYIGFPSTGIPYSSNLGHFETPPFTPYGWSTSGAWFKSTDKYTRMTNGTWTRTEQWTFTDDTTHAWIYHNLPSS